MSADGLFHIDGKGELVSMAPTPYEYESVLQELLASHPDLLAGGQMTPESPRRWLLMRREQAVPDRDASAGRWSVDHLFVDQDAVPTLVEVKRSSDTRIRREVVGQMLDYAANGVRYWPLGDLRASLIRTQEDLGNDPEAEVRRLLDDPNATIDDFFASIADNLRAGRLRMVFVADVIPDELMRITEFLNEQMNPAQVFAVEVKQYRADGYPGSVIVPAVFGRTAAASLKPTGARRTATRDEALTASRPETLQLIELASELAAELGLIVQETPSATLLKTRAMASVAIVYLASWDSLEVPLQPLRDRGWTSEADSIGATLQTITDKRLTAKAPNLPSVDAVAAWDTVSQLIRQIASLHAEHAN
ncbi:MAG TPA: hypothetical protein VFO98_09990 [Marmoricola sp.]|nr:hypothetical protein [Marmoricola sp.]